MTSQIGIPANASHTQTMTSPTIGYHHILGVQGGSILQSMTVAVIDPWISGSIPEIIPFSVLQLQTVTSPWLSPAEIIPNNAIHTSTVTSPTLFEHA